MLKVRGLILELVSPAQCRQRLTTAATFMCCVSRALSCGDGPQWLMQGRALGVDTPPPLTIAEKIVLLAYLSSCHEKATVCCTSLLRSYRPSVYHTEMGILLSAFSKGATSKHGGLFHTVLLMLNVKQGNCEYQFLSHSFDPTLN